MISLYRESAYVNFLYLTTPPDVQPSKRMKENNNKFIVVL